MALIYAPSSTERFTFHIFLLSLENLTATGNSREKRASKPRVLKILLYIKTLARP